MVFLLGVHVLGGEVAVHQLWHGAEETLAELLKLAEDPGKNYYIGGYSLAGLFALWAACQTDLFRGVAAASPSMWFPGFLEYIKEHPIRSGRVYLSLGDREEKTRNPVMATVGDCIREGYELLKNCGFRYVSEFRERQCEFIPLT